MKGTVGIWSYQLLDNVKVQAVVTTPMLRVRVTDLGEHGVVFNLGSSERWGVSRNQDKLGY